MSEYTSKKLSFNNAEQFKESFFEPEPATIGYVFIGNHIPYANESNPDIISDTIFDEKTIWDNMFAAKKITGNDVELVVPKKVWEAGKKYKQYDDKLELENLISSNASQNIESFYVMNSERNVYKCLSNNISSISTIEPTGQNLTANGVIETGDGYVWKYIFNIKPSNKFLTNEWMPAPTSVTKLDYSPSSLVPVDGELVKIVVTNSGSGYIHSNVTVSSFSSGCTQLTLANTTNVSENMLVAGLGIPTGTHIQSVDLINTRITLSLPTTSNGGGSGNTILVSTRISIEGDGTGATATPILNNNSIQKIEVTSFGKNYTFGNVIIYGTGTNASARVVLPPKYGHGYNPAKEIGATNVMISVKIGEIDSTENGLISSNTTFRQYGLLKDPHEYGSNSAVNKSNSEFVVSQTTDVTLIAGDAFDLNEFVYQGSSINNTTFSGYVHAQSANEVRLTMVKGSITIGSVLKGESTNPTGRTVVSLTPPEFQPYSGDVLYVDNIEKIQREDGQAENIKFVVKF